MSEEQDREFVGMSRNLRNSVKFFVEKLSDPEVCKSLSAEAVKELSDNMREMITILIPATMTVVQNPGTPR